MTVNSAICMFLFFRYACWLLSPSCGYLDLVGNGIGDSIKRKRFEVISDPYCSLRQHIF